MKALSLICIGILLGSCRPGDNPEVAHEEFVIAQVGDKKLYQSRFKDLYDSPIDSVERTMMIKGYISTWIKDQLLVVEAEKNLPPDLEINELVEDYRSSLMVNHYVNQLVSTLLDTIVTEEQIRTYYEENKTEFILSESVMKGVVLKIPLEKSSKAIRNQFKNQEYDELRAVTKSFAQFPMLLDDEWHATSEVLAFLPSPPFTENSLKTKGDHSRKDRNFEYFVKTVDFAEKNEIPPLEFIESKIIQVILNNRKKTLINRKKQQLYDQNYNSQKIKINL